ncbi:MAG TPA: hypothetical protein VKP89_04510 [Burkholderiales bacterium]|nr:hypothetical protein [Burkholderiales bacterium]
MNTEQPDSEQPDPAPSAEQPAQPAQPDPRRRLRELLAIPERDRSDAVWDEIIELEIDLAPGNRASAPQGNGGRRQEPGRPQQPPGGQRAGGRPFKKPRRRGGR